MSTQAHLELAASELGVLGVRARAIWELDEWAPGVSRVRPGVEIGASTYTTDESSFGSQQAAMDWAAVVATLERGVRA